MATDVAVIILTHNEEANLAQALRSVSGWAREVVIADSYSSDHTVAIAQSWDARVYQHQFEDYGRQRNWALSEIPIEAEWILFLDADEWLTAELKDEIACVVASRPEQNGFYIKWRLIWMGKWIRREYYPTWIVRLVRHGKARCDQRSCNEHLVVDGKVGFLSCDFVHEDRKGISDWISKHNRYATLEASELLKAENSEQEISARFWGGSQVERKRWLRYRVWNRMPPLLRPLFYFVYRSILCGGFLDGPRALVYHFLQALWYWLLIDLKYLEMRGLASSGVQEDKPSAQVFGAGD